MHSIDFLQRANDSGVWMIVGVVESGADDEERIFTQASQQPIVPRNRRAVVRNLKAVHRAEQRPQVELHSINNRIGACDVAG